MTIHANCARRALHSTVHVLTFWRRPPPCAASAWPWRPRALPEEVDDEGHVVVLAPHVLRLPPRALLLLEVHLPLQLGRRHVASRQCCELSAQRLGLARDDGHQVEANLGTGVALDTRLDSRLHGLQPIGAGGQLPEQHGPLLQPVELVQLASHGHIRDEVVEVVVLGGGALLVVGDEGVGRGEGVVRGAHELGVGDREAFELGVELLGEALEARQLLAQLDLVRVRVRVRARVRVRVGDREDGLRRARVGDDLLGEEEVVLVVRGGRAVVRLRQVLLPLEQEDQPVHLAQLAHRVAVERVDLLELHTLDAHLLDELGEDAGVRLDRAPIAHAPRIFADKGAGKQT
eukprot:scaffold14396_cov48-Phaeocystis_antarctica.AAC.1